MRKTVFPILAAVGLAAVAGSTGAATDTVPLEIGLAVAAVVWLSGSRPTRQPRRS